MGRTAEPSSLLRGTHGIHPESSHPHRLQFHPHQESQPPQSIFSRFSLHVEFCDWPKPQNIAAPNNDAIEFTLSMLVFALSSMANCLWMLRDGAQRP